MRFARWVLVVVAIVGGLLATARWSLLAQERGGRGPVRAKAEPAEPRNAGVSVQDALLRPLDLPFAQETTLEEVRQYLGKALGAQVVLDRGALDRLDLAADDTVQIDLKGVRLKVGLALLLDQVGMAFRVEPEDNLLILTDPQGSDDANKRMQAELKSLHRELHDLQDSVDDLLDLVEEDLGIAPEKPKHSSPLVRLERRLQSPRRNPTSRAKIHSHSRPQPGVGG